MISEFGDRSISQMYGRSGPYEQFAIGRQTVVLVLELKSEKFESYYYDYDIWWNKPLRCYRWYLSSKPLIDHF